jgi:hypothetical protein
MKEMPLTCMYKPSSGWNLGCSEHVEYTVIRLKHWCKKCAFCWFLLIWCLNVRLVRGWKEGGVEMVTAWINESFEKGAMEIGGKGGRIRKWWESKQLCGEMGMVMMNLRVFLHPLVFAREK